MSISQNGTLELDRNVCQCCGSASNANEESVSTKKEGITYVILGWMFFTISLLFMPIIFGTAALFMGLMTFLGRRQVHGAILIFFAATGLVLGTLFSYIVSGTIFI